MDEELERRMHNAFQIGLSNGNAPNTALDTAFRAVMNDVMETLTSTFFHLSRDIEIGVYDIPDMRIVR